MATVSTQDSLIERWIQDLDRTSERARRLTGDLSEEQLRWTPPDGGWSIARVFQHLVTAHSQYLEIFPTLIERARVRGGAAAGGEWRPSLAGRLMLRTLDPRSTRRVPTPRSWRPAAEAHAGAVEEFLRTQEELKGHMRAAAGLDLNRVRTASPASRLIRLNLGDCFAILTVHGQRHMGQVERIRSSAGFPRVG